MSRINIIHDGKATGFLEINEVIQMLKEGKVWQTSPCVLEVGGGIKRLEDVIPGEMGLNFACDLPGEKIIRSDGESYSELALDENFNSASKWQSPSTSEKKSRDNYLDSISRVKRSARVYDEGLVHLGRPSLLHYPKSFFTSTVLMLLGAYFFAQGSSLGVIMFLIGALIFGIFFIDRTFSTHWIWNNKIEKIHGIIAKNSNEVRIKNITSINVVTDNWRGLLGIGNVEIYTAGDKPEIILPHINRAIKIKDLINSLQEKKQKN